MRRAATSEGGPLGNDAFAALMATVGPFESAPLLAVAVSGGADSLALAILADRWARDRGGAAIAVTVDHGLRRESAGEAIQLGRWLEAREVRHRILAWAGPKPASGLQEAARAARYELLRRFCREHGILHLLLAHHRDDQAETFVMRLGRGSGVDGLAAMEPVVPIPEGRLVRPLLAVPRSALHATLAACGQEWVEDPSNRDAKYLRTRIRREMPALAALGLDAARLAGTAARMGRARRALDEAATRLLVAAASLDPAGFARLDPTRLAAAPEEIGLRALARLLRTIGGGSYPPRLERLERLWRDVAAGLRTRRSFAGCLLMPRRGHLLVCREPADVAPPLAIRAGESVHWDNRFLLGVSGRGGGEAGAVGAEGWAAVRGIVRSGSLPAAAMHGLPAWRDEFSVAAIPALGYRRASPPPEAAMSANFVPISQLSGGLVWNADSIMC